MIITFGSILTILVMIACLVGIVISVKKMKEQTNPNAGRNASILTVILIIACFVYMKKQDFIGSGNLGTLLSNEVIYNNATGLILGKYLAEKMPSAKVLVIASINYEKNEKELGVIKNLKKGFSDKIQDVKVEPYAKAPAVSKPATAPGQAMPPPTNMPSSPPLSVRPTAAELDAIIEINKDRTLIVSLVSLPYNIEEMAIWELEPQSIPRIAVIDAYISSNLKKAITEGIILALVVHNPDMKYSEAPAPSDPQKAFDERYLLITTENIGPISEKYPQIFMKTP